MTLIGVLSDTHGRLDPRAYAALIECDRIIHAGDVCNPSILRKLQTIGPVDAVLGNNDIPGDYPSDVRRLSKPVIDGVRFLIAHYPSDVQISFAGSSAVAPGDPIPHVCIHGHTHIPRLDWGRAAYPARFVMNPGSVSGSRGGFPASIGKIVVEDGRVLSAVIESLDGEVLFEAGSSGAE